jgi:hypothetical protein
LKFRGNPGKSEKFQGISRISGKLGNFEKVGKRLGKSEKFQGISGIPGKFRGNLENFEKVEKS